MLRLFRSGRQPNYLEPARSSSRPLGGSKRVSVARVAQSAAEVGRGVSRRTYRGGGRRWAAVLKRFEVRAGGGRASRGGCWEPSS